MAEDFPHLTLQREKPVTNKRSGSYVPPPPPGDVRGHGLGLLRDLADAKQQVETDLGGFDDRKLIKFSVDNHDQEHL